MKNLDKNEVCVIFQSPEEEAQFSKIARDIMMYPENHRIELTEEKPRENTVVVIFQSPEEEEFFSRYTQKLNGRSSRV